MRDKLRRLQKLMRGSLEAIEQAHSATLYIEPQRASEDRFLFLMNSLRADYHREARPEPPECLKAVAGARNRPDALERVMRGSSFLPISEQHLVEEGRFVPRTLVAGSEYEPTGGGEE